MKTLHECRRRAIHWHAWLPKSKLVTNPLFPVALLFFIASLEGPYEQEPYPYEESKPAERVISFPPAQSLCTIDSAPSRISEPLRKPSSKLLQLGMQHALIEIYYRNPARIHRNCLTSSTGDVRINRLYELGSVDQWFMEYQHRRADFIHGGLATNNHSLTLRGIFVLNWAVKHLQGVTNFQHAGGDWVHLATFFFEAATRDALLLLSEDQCTNFIYESLMPVLLNMPIWDRDPFSSAMHGQHRFTNIKLIRAAAYMYLLNILDKQESLYDIVSQSAMSYYQYG